MSRIYIPASEPEDWKQLLAKPDKHWRTGYSAKTLANCWQRANGFPVSVKKVFRGSGIALFQNLELLLAFPEYKVSLPPKGGRPSQNDIFILAKGNDQLVSITVEGKVNEAFDIYVSEWKAKEGSGKATRLRFLCRELQLEMNQVEHIRYQLLHRAASALIQAKKFGAKNALMLVHSFCRGDELREGFEDYSQFLALYGLTNVKTDSVLYAKSVNGVDLYFAWVRGEEKYLDD